MALINMAGLRARLGPGRRLIGIDPGARRIGVAVSDALLLIASPHAVLARGRLAANAEAILQIARRMEADGLVVGLPLSMDGTLGPAAQAARDWAHARAAATGLPTAMWDERLSSAAAQRVLIGEADLSRRRRGALVDAMAAAWMLQGALDASDTRNQ